MKRIINFLQRTPCLPAIAFLVIYLCANCLFDNFSQYIDTGISGIGQIANIAIALALLEITMRIGYGQLKVQKDNIKLQMFDKRYKVFQTVVDASLLLNRNDHIITGLYNYNHINSMGVQMTEIYDKLFNSMLVSQALFDIEIFEKVGKIHSLFGETRKEYYQLSKNGVEYEELINRNRDVIENILVMNADNVEQINIELNKIIPNLATILVPWQKSVIEFNNYIESSGILRDFDKYLLIHNLDN